MRLFCVQVDKHTSLEFIVQCLLYCQTHQSVTSPGFKHLLLEVIPPEAAAQGNEAIKAGAVQLFHAYCTATDAKLAAKVASIFKLTRDDLTDWTQVTQALQQLLQNQTSYKAAVHIMMQFEVRPRHMPGFSSGRQQLFQKSLTPTRCRQLLWTSAITMNAAECPGRFAVQPFTMLVGPV